MKPRCACPDTHNCGVLNCGTTEEVLGAGMAVFFNDSGVVAFVLVDEYNHEIIVRTEDLDTGWEAKLRAALDAKWKKS